MGHLVDMAFFADADSCGMEIGFTDGTKMTCCNNETIVIDGQDDLSITWDDTSLELPWQIAPVRYISLFQVCSEAERPLPNEYYPPPSLVEDIPLRDQVFLI